MFYLMSQESQHWYYANGNVVKILNGENQGKLNMLLPNLNEQIRIANYLDNKCLKIDQTIEKEKQLIEKLKEYKQSVITEAVTKGLNPNVKMKNSGVEWIGEIPEEWNICKLGYISKMIVPMRDKPTAFDGDIPWIRIEDFNGKYIEKSKSNQNVTKELIDEMNMKVYPVGTVLCSCSCDLGRCAIVKKEMCSNQTFIGIVPGENLHSDFLYYLMLSNAKRLNYLAGGSIQAYLSRKSYENLKVQLPKINEQISIADYLDKKCSSIDKLISDKEKLIEKLTEYKKSLIYECVTGKREVQ